VNIITENSADDDIDKTNSTELSPSWEAASSAAIQELLNILWNSTAHYHVPKILPLGPILNQINPVQTTPFYLSKIRFNIIHPPTSWGLFLSSLFTTILHAFLFAPFVLHALPISSSLTWF
jgi:hypothetical protein